LKRRFFDLRVFDDVKQKLLHQSIQQNHAISIRNVGRPLAVNSDLQPVGLLHPNGQPLELGHERLLVVRRGELCAQAAGNVESVGQLFFGTTRQGLMGYTQGRTLL
jgi:hypothetical protein